MKKLLSLLLCTALLLAALPASYAAPAVYDEYDDVPPVREIVPPVDQDGNCPALMRDVSSVTVTVALPEGARAGAGSNVNVQLFSAAALDENGVVLASPANRGGRTASFDNGETASVTFPDVQPGKYILRVYPYLDSPDVDSRQYYFGENGAASSQFTAVPFTVGEGESVSRTVTLERAASSVSGTIRFGRTPESDMLIWLFSNTVGSPSVSRRSRILVPAGASEASFAIGMGAEPAFIQFEGDDISLFYCVDDTLDADSGKRMVFDLTDGPVTDLEVDGDSLLSGDSVTVRLTVKLPERLTEERRFFVSAADTEGDPEEWRDSFSTTVAAGKNSFDVDFAVMAGRTTYFSYFDYTDAQIDSSYDIPGRVFIAADGITTDPEKAEGYIFNSDASVTIPAPDSVRLSGTLERGDLAPGAVCAGYVLATFDNGERFAARVVFNETKQTKSFVLHVPSKLVGQAFTLSCAPARELVYAALDGDSEREIGSFILTEEDMSFGDIRLTKTTPETVAYSGTVALPEGVTAPVGGTAVSVSANGRLGYVVIPEGQNETCFAFEGNESSGALSAQLAAATEGIYYRTRVSSSEREGVELRLWPEAVISGTVTLPSGLDTAYNARVTAAHTLGTSTAYVSIRRGGQSARFRLRVPDGTELTRLMLNAPQFDSSGAVPVKSWFIGEDWRQTDKASSLTVNGSRGGLSFRPVVSPAVIGAGDGEEPMQQLGRTGELTADVFTGSIAPGTPLIGFAALYDENGRFLGAAAAEDEANYANRTELSFTFGGAYQDAASAGIFVTGGNYAPIADCLKLD